MREGEGTPCGSSYCWTKVPSPSHAFGAGPTLSQRRGTEAQILFILALLFSAFFAAPALPASKDGLACTTVVLRPGDALILPVSWGLHYNISGYMAADNTSAVSAQGWMINPQNPAQALDIITKESGVTPVK